VLITGKEKEQGSLNRFDVRRRKGDKDSYGRGRFEKGVTEWPHAGGVTWSAARTSSKIFRSRGEKNNSGCET